ncbi:hypothetical protein GOODEAATRI_030020 [Goodea atripinnis]|uniref:G-protein coupled receptors family 1 profile domain-containing protein n=1 Tax=Goodea atripinnis TaxID=208336 RepID=A0ABV0PST1_9TELE
MHVIYTANLYSSILILAFISLDRYLAVIRATDNLSTRKLLASRVIYLGVWLPAAILTIPDLVFARVQEVGFVLPGLVILVCYCILFSSLSRGDKLPGAEEDKSSEEDCDPHRLLLRLLAALLPWHLRGHDAEHCCCLNLTAVSSCCDVQRAMETWISVMVALAYFHCCLNPILYAFLGVKFNQTPRSTLAIIIRGSSGWSQKTAPLTNNGGQISSSVSTESKSSGVLLS